VSSSGPARVDACIEACSRLRVFVRQQLADEFETAGVGVQPELGSQMSELMRSEFHTKIPEHGSFDCNLYCTLRSRLASKCDEYGIRALAGNAGAISIR
jgi:hypothetical protein